jgi:hypothetical protein
MITRHKYIPWWSGMHGRVSSQNGHVEEVAGLTIEQCLTYDAYDPVQKDIIEYLWMRRHFYD